MLLGEAVQHVAKIGGYVGRKNDPPPRASNSLAAGGSASVYMHGLCVARYGRTPG